MLQIEEAQALLASQVSEITETEVLDITQTYGRVLAEDVLAERDQPPFPRSPLDGYAVKGDDTAGASAETPVTLEIIGNIYAGEVFSGTVQTGQAVRLTTGAPIPDGADSIIRQEDTDYGLSKVEIYKPVKPYQNYCYQGEDYKAGTIMIEAGHQLHGGSICVLSSLGKEKVMVRRQAKVAVISTGDEVIAPGTPWTPGKIYDSNRSYVCARLAEMGNPATISRHIGDTAQAVANAVKEAAAVSDFIITTGGVSVGEKDIMHEVITILGATQLFWKVNIKPGSPTLAFVYEGTLVLSLSGNPYGAIANFELLARPVLKKLTGQTRWDIRTAQAQIATDFKKKAGARRFLRGYEENGQVYVNGRNQASGAISAMVDCNCMLEIRPDMDGAAKGTYVKVYYFN